MTTSDGAKSQPSSLLRELTQLAIGMALIGTLFIALWTGPLWLSRTVGAWWGVAAAALLIPIWPMIVRPMPGLTAGALSLGGFFALTGHAIALLIRAW